MMFCYLDKDNVFYLNDKNYPPYLSEAILSKIFCDTLKTVPCHITCRSEVLVLDEQIVNIILFEHSSVYYRKS